MIRHFKPTYPRNHRKLEEAASGIRQVRPGTEAEHGRLCKDGLSSGYLREVCRRDRTYTAKLAFFEIAKYCPAAFRYKNRRVYESLKDVLEVLDGSKLRSDNPVRNSPGREGRFSNRIIIATISVLSASFDEGRIFAPLICMEPLERGNPHR